MAEFKFALGAAVVLVTSAALVMDQMDDEREQRAREEARAARGPAEGDEEDLAIGRIAFGIVEEGQIIGRAEYLSAEPSYLVLYRDGSGRQVEEFHRESALTTREAIAEEYEREPAAGGGEQQ